MSTTRWPSRVSPRWQLVVAAAAVLMTVGGERQAQAQQNAGVTRLELTSGSKAEYRVREQLARLKFPNDAVGATQSVSGTLVLVADGTFAAGSSKLTVDLRTLKSDEGRRDAYLRERTLQTDRFPLAEFVPRRAQGLTLPMPASGSATFQLIGDMTLHGVTSGTTLNVVASLGPDLVTGTAGTRFPFRKFGLTIPSLMGLISVDDDIRLEITFRARRVEGR